jgi:hypothetical protein
MKQCFLLVPMMLLLVACGGDDDDTTASGGGGGGAGGGGGGQLADGGNGGGVGGGGGDSTTGCTWSTTGAVAASGECTFSAAYSSDEDEVGFSFVDNGGVLSFGGALVGKRELTTGTYTLADAPTAGGAFNQGTAALWDACNDDMRTDGNGDAIPNQGTFTLTISDPGPSTAGLLWQAAHGTLTATLPADPNTPASGVITATAEF